MLLPFGAPPGLRNYAPVYNVKTFGAKVDGVTDDATAINAAISAANTAGGGTVVIPAGTAIVGSPIIPLNNVWLMGVGMFQTKLKSTSNSTFAILDNTSIYNSGNPYTNGIVSDLQIDGTNYSPANGKKGFAGRDCINCLFARLYIHDTTATGFGVDDLDGCVVTQCIVQNCGYNNKKTITGASWAANTFTFTIPSHGYSASHAIIITGMSPQSYNGVYNVTSVVDSNTITIGDSGNNTTSRLTIDQNPGTATVFGVSSDSVLGQNGFGIASGALANEGMIVCDNIAINNQNNNFLIEADTTGTGDNASYIFANNISVQAGQCGYRNTGTINVQYENNFDYASPYGIFVAATTTSFTITAASWAGGVATYTATNTLTVGQYVGISGMTPSGYNGFYYVQSASSSQFTVNITNNPGTATVFGSAQTVVHPVDNTIIAGNTLTDNLWFGINVNPQSNGVSAFNNTVKNSINYGLYWASGNGSIANNRIYNNGIEGIWLYTGGSLYMPLDNMNISYNKVYNNGQKQASKDGISVNSSNNTPIQNLQINGNHCFDNQNTATQRYGIIIRSGGDNSNIYVHDNIMTGNTTGAALFQDTGATIFQWNNAGVSGIVSKSSAYTATTADRVILVTGNTTITLPTAVGFSGWVREFTIKKTDSNVTTATVATTSAQTIDGAASVTLNAQNEAITVQSDGSNWQVVHQVATTIL